MQRETALFICEMANDRRGGSQRGRRRALSMCSAGPVVLAGRSSPGGRPSAVAWPRSTATLPVERRISRGVGASIDRSGTIDQSTASVQ